MVDRTSWLPVARRSFLSRMGIGVAALGTGVASALPGRAEAAAAPARWQPALHTLDGWFDQPSAKHRFVFDTTTPAAAGGALLYVNNYVTANKIGYNLEPGDLAIVIVLRHFSTPFAYNDMIWSKYGAQMSEAVGFTDPKTKQAPPTNLYNSPDYGFSLPNFGTTMDSLIQRGARFAVCDMATHFFAGMLAEKTQSEAARVYQELVANMIPNSHLVPAGIVAVNRAQERGYSFAYVA